MRTAILIHGFLFINTWLLISCDMGIYAICCTLGFQHSPRDIANVNEWKIIFDPYSNNQQNNYYSVRRSFDWPNN